MTSEPDLEHGIYRLTHTLIVGGKRYTCESDFIRRDDELLVVLDWGETRGNQFPLVTQEIDPSKLRDDPRGPGYFLYSGDIEDPRKVQ